MKVPPLFCAAFLLAGSALAEVVPRALPEGEKLQDARLEPLKELDGYFPFTPSPNRAAWNARAEEVRMQLRVALGLWPEPTRTPLNAVIHGRIDGDDYTVEKVFFESMPGLFVTGNLYRPKGQTGPFPAVLCPHGHWKDARFALRTDAEMKKEIATGGERLPESGRSMFQSIGVQLARMGIVAFVYDMLGYCDSQQLSYELTHKFARQRPEMNTREYWGLFGTQAETHAQNVMGLQTWNSMRALDFLTALPDVDAKRLGCTGASGGGTQTMMLAALDPRLTVACPAVMVSTAMQGGCTCENASLLRCETGNVEIAALFAPKPQGLTAANDWTKEMETKGFPELKQHYAMLGAPENVALWARLEFPHNYNLPARESIYAWFDRHFALGLAPGRLTERDYRLLSRDELTVWNAAHPAPAGGGEFERKLLRWWFDDSEAQLARTPRSLVKTAAPGWRAIVGAAPRLTQETHARAVEVPGLGQRKYRATVRTQLSEDRSREIPTLTIEPQLFGGITVLYLAERGKEGLFLRTTLHGDVINMLESGIRVIGVDLIGQGESVVPDTTATRTRDSKNPREAAAFTFGYNRALFAQRVQDVCSLVQALQAQHPHGRHSVVALDGTGPIAAVALAVQSGIDSAVLDTRGFRFSELRDIHSPHFLPGGARYGDLPGALATATRDPRNVPRLYLIGEGATPPTIVKAAYAAVERSAYLRASEKRIGSASLAAWLLQNRLLGLAN
jgi:dienelactone hydrolase